MTDLRKGKFWMNPSELEWSVRRFKKDQTPSLESMEAALAEAWKSISEVEFDKGDQYHPKEELELFLGDGWVKESKGFLLVDSNQLVHGVKVAPGCQVRVPEKDGKYSKGYVLVPFNECTQTDLGGIQGVVLYSNLSEGVGEVIFRGHGCDSELYRCWDYSETPSFKSVAQTKKKIEDGPYVDQIRNALRSVGIFVNSEEPSAQELDVSLEEREGGKVVLCEPKSDIKGFQLRQPSVVTFPKVSGFTCGDNVYNGRVYVPLTSQKGLDGIVGVEVYMPIVGESR